MRGPKSLLRPVMKDQVESQELWAALTSSGWQQPPCTGTSRCGTPRKGQASTAERTRELVKEGFGGRDTPETGLFCTFTSVYFLIWLPCPSRKLSRGDKAGVGNGAGNHCPVPACLPVTPLQAARFSGPLQWLQNMQRSQLQPPRPAEFRLLQIQSLLFAA